METEVTGDETSEQPQSENPLERMGYNERERVLQTQIDALKTELEEIKAALIRGHLLNPQSQEDLGKPINPDDPPHWQFK